MLIDSRASSARPEILAALNHPNIAQIYGVADADGVRALVIELVEGPTLADRLSRGAIALDEALTIARQVAEALEAAHERGIIHRDLKPANIKLTPDGVVKVLDFGLAKAVESTGAAGLDASAATFSRPAVTRAGIILGTAALYEPGAGARPRRRCAHGHLGLRVRVVRDAHRSLRVRGRDDD
jgi:serine/threonine protein kinase